MGDEWMDPKKWRRSSCPSDSQESTSPPKREEGLSKEEAERVMHSLKGALGKRGES